MKRAGNVAGAQAPLALTVRQDLVDLPHLEIIKPLARYTDRKFHTLFAREHRF
jgi:hypothetical protein